MPYCEHCKPIVFDDNQIFHEMTCPYNVSDNRDRPKPKTKEADDAN